jgi:putative MATE family efflux protein
MSASLEESAASPRQPAPLDRPVWQQVLMLAWPVLLQNWLVTAVHLSDRLLAGRFQDVGAAEQAATQAAQTTANYLGWLLSSYTALITIGSTALVARMIGARDRRTARLLLHQSLLLALTLGLVGMALGLVFLDRLLQVLRLQEVAAGYAAGYLRPLLYALPLQMVGMAGIACLAGAGDTRTGMWVLGGITLINLPLAWGFFSALGFVGIAVGTALSQGLGGLVVLLVLYVGRAHLRLRLRHLMPHPALIGRILRISIPAAMDNLSMMVGQLWFLGIVNDLGDTAAAAHGIALTWEALGFYAGAAFGTAALTVVGQSLGAGQPERAARGGWLAFAMGTGVMCAMGLLFFTLADPMFRLFCPHPSQEAIVTTGIPALRLIAFGMPACGVCIILAAALRGAGDTRYPMLFTWVGFFVLRIPLAYLFTLPAPRGWELGLVGAWLAMVTDLQIRGLFLLVRYLRGGWKLIEV